MAAAAPATSSNSSTGLSLTLRQRPHLGWISTGWSGLLTLPESERATIEGKVEVRVGGQPVPFLQTLKVELKKTETVLTSKGVKRYFELIGSEEQVLWRGQGRKDVDKEGFAPIETCDLAFSIPVPAGLPPSISLEKSKSTGIAYHIVATARIKPRSKGLFSSGSGFKAPTLVSGFAEVVIEKHELNPLWPIYAWQAEQESLATSTANISMKLRRQTVIYGAGDAMRFDVKIKSERNTPVKITRLELTLSESIVSRELVPGARAPGTDPRKVVSQVSDVVTLKTNVNSLLYSQESTSHTLAASLPLTHQRYTVQNAKHLEIKYFLRLRAIVEIPKEAKQTKKKEKETPIHARDPPIKEVILDKIPVLVSPWNVKSGEYWKAKIGQVPDNLGRPGGEGQTGHQQQPLQSPQPQPQQLQQTVQAGEVATPPQAESQRIMPTAAASQPPNGSAMPQVSPSAFVPISAPKPPAHYRSPSQTYQSQSLGSQGYEDPAQSQGTIHRPSRVSMNSSGNIRQPSRSRPSKPVGEQPNPLLQHVQPSYPPKSPPRTNGYTDHAVSQRNTTQPYQQQQPPQQQQQQQQRQSPQLPQRQDVSPMQSYQQPVYAQSQQSQDNQMLPPRPPYNQRASGSDSSRQSQSPAMYPAATPTQTGQPLGQSQQPAGSSDSLGQMPVGAAARSTEHIQRTPQVMIPVEVQPASRLQSTRPKSIAYASTGLAPSGTLSTHQKSASTTSLPRQAGTVGSASEVTAANGARIPAAVFSGRHLSSFRPYSPAFHAHREEYQRQNGGETEAEKSTAPPLAPTSAVAAKPAALSQPAEIVQPQPQRNVVSQDSRSNAGSPLRGSPSSPVPQKLPPIPQQPGKSTSSPGTGFFPMRRASMSPAIPGAPSNRLMRPVSHSPPASIKHSNSMQIHRPSPNNGTPPSFGSVMSGSNVGSLPHTQLLHGPSSEGGHSHPRREQVTSWHGPTSPNQQYRASPAAFAMDGPFPSHQRPSSHSPNFPNLMGQSLGADGSASPGPRGQQQQRPEQGFGYATPAGTAVSMPALSVQTQSLETAPAVDQVRSPDRETVRSGPSVSALPFDQPRRRDTMQPQPERQMAQQNPTAVPLHRRTSDHGVDAVPSRRFSLSTITASPATSAPTSPDTPGSALTPMALPAPASETEGVSPGSEVYASSMQKQVRQWESAEDEKQRLYTDAKALARQTQERAGYSIPEPAMLGRSLNGYAPVQDRVQTPLSLMRSLSHPGPIRQKSGDFLSLDAAMRSTATEEPSNRNSVYSTHLPYLASQSVDGHGDSTRSYGQGEAQDRPELDGTSVQQSYRQQLGSAGPPPIPHATRPHTRDTSSASTSSQRTIDQQKITYLQALAAREAYQQRMAGQTDILPLTALEEKERLRLMYEEEERREAEGQSRTDEPENISQPFQPSVLYSPGSVYLTPATQPNYTTANGRGGAHLNSYFPTPNSSSSHLPSASDYSSDSLQYPRIPAADKGKQRRVASYIESDADQSIEENHQPSLPPVRPAKPVSLLKEQLRHLDSPISPPAEVFERQFFFKHSGSSVSGH